MVIKNNSSMHELRAAFSPQPMSSSAEKVAWLRTELRKGIDSGVSNRSLEQIYDDVIAKRNEG